MLKEFNLTREEILGLAGLYKKYAAIETEIKDVKRAIAKRINKKEEEFAIDWKNKKVIVR